MFYFQISKTITPGAVVYDIGAHVSFYTLLAARLVSPGGKVVAFEPVPQNIYYLKEHLRLNRCLYAGKFFVTL